MNFFFAAALLLSQPDGAFHSFYEEMNNNEYPYRPMHQGVLDGDRKPPLRVSFADHEKAAAKNIEYLIVILQENWSFDALYGNFSGANGLQNASNAEQTDLTGTPYPTLLTCVDTRTGKPFPNIPEGLKNSPFNLAPYFPINKTSGSALHRFFQEQYQINGGKMDRFAAFSTAGGFVMSYYDIHETEMMQLAKEYVLCDNWFHSCYGGSTCGAIWLFSAQMPLWPSPPEELTARLLPSGILIKDGLATHDGYAINDAEPYYPPHQKGLHFQRRMPPQNYPTIGDRLNEKNISWKWYAEGWNKALEGKPDSSFPYHHQAPVFFTQYAPNSDARKAHLADLDDFYLDIKNPKTMPAISFIRSLNIHSEHPGSAPLLDGLNWCSTLIKAIQKSAIWNKCAIIVTYDENGGRWDHVSPPVVDRFGPGTRVPAIIISPFAKKGFIDSTSYETVSILKFIEERWQLRPLSTRDAQANNILNAFDFTKNP